MMSNTIKDKATPTPIKASVFPKAEKRPVFNVYYEDVEYGGKCYQKGVYYHTLEHDPKGLQEPLLIDTWICSPLEVTARYVDEQQKAGRIIKALRDDIEGVQELFIPNELLAKVYDPPIFPLLASYGIDYNKEQRKLLLSYLEQKPQKVYRLVAMTGWNDTLTAFGLGDEVIGQADVVIRNQSKDYLPRRTLQVWQNSVGKLSMHNPLLQLSILGSLASPLLAFIDQTGAGLHFFGVSGKGKTTILKAGASVWGNSNVFIRSWKATANGIEELAKQRNDTLIVLDEMAGNDVKTVDETIYSLINGAPKQRARARNGSVSACETKHWRTMVISSGEKSINDFLTAKLNNPPMAGQAVRFLDIPATTREYGAFDVLHGFDKPAKLSEAISNATRTYYGTAGRAMVQYLIEVTPPIQSLFSEARERIAEDHTSTEEDRVLRIFALLLMTGELAIEAYILPWTKDDVLSAVKAGFELWRSERGLKGENLAKIQVLRAFRDKTLKCPHLFADNGVGMDNITPLNPVLGWYVDKKAMGELISREYQILVNNLTTLTDGRISDRETADIFDSIGALTKDDGRKTTKRTIKGLGRQRVYAINAQKVYRYMEENELL